MKTLFSCTGIIILISLIFGCSDDPSIIGLGLLPTQDNLKVDSLESIAIYDTTFSSHFHGTANTLVGKYKDASLNSPIEARALIQFIGFSSIPVNAKIDSAVMKIPINYKFKNSSGQLGFSIHEMRRTWDERTFSWDSCQAAFSDTIAATIIKPISDNDTILYVRIDTLVKRWVQNSVDAPDGIILIPTPIEGDLIVGSQNMSNHDTRPLLTVTYRDSVDSVFTYKPNSNQRTFVANGPIPSSSNLIFIQAGIAYRGLLRFDSLSVPKNASITQATLDLSTDDNSSLLNTFKRDSLVVYLLRKNFSPFDSLALGIICSPQTVGTKKIYRGEIKSIVQQWVTREPNYGIVIRSYGEFSSFDRFAVYGSTATTALRPKLTIKYTILP